MKTHVVTVNFKGAGFEFKERCVCACPGDAIKWVFNGRRDDSGGDYAGTPFVVIIKDFLSPLNWSFKKSPKGSDFITGKVRRDAEYGCYSYAFCALKGSALLVDDPEIIIKPPKGR
jgi:hypothetical protein